LFPKNLSENASVKCLVKTFNGKNNFLAHESVKMFRFSYGELFSRVRARNISIWEKHLRNCLD
jgi:hypothetical protein